jgi:hypothetical protein
VPQRLRCFQWERLSEERGGVAMEATIQRLKEAIAARDQAAVLGLVQRLPAELLPEARKLVETIPDQEQARAAVLAVDERADTLGVALSA